MAWNSVGAVIGSRLQQKRLEVRQLAEQAGASLSTVAAVIEGADVPIPLSELLSVLKLLGVEVDQIVVRGSIQIAVKSPSFGARLRELRQSHDLNQKEAATRAGVPLPSYSQYENDRRSPTFATVLKIAKSFGVDANYFAECDFSEDRDES